MAKIPTTRLNNAPIEYNSTSFDLLIEDLNYIVQFLNSTYPKDQEDEEDRKIWFFTK
jgi:predicted chitinase